MAFSLRRPCIAIQRGARFDTGLNEIISMKKSLRFQLHLSTCVILMFLSGALMAVYFQFSNILFTYDLLADSYGSQFAMKSSFIAFCVSILIGAAFVCEKMAATPAPATVRSK